MFRFTIFLNDTILIGPDIVYAELLVAQMLSCMTLGNLSSLFFVDSSLLFSKPYASKSVKKSLN
jgi:hypothetical protein